MRASHRSLEPLLARSIPAPVASCKLQVAQPPEDSTFQWHIRLPADGIPHGHVYADESRLYAEQKYCNLKAGQGWAFAVLDGDGVVVASASGRAQCWAVGIHAAGLWALLNASELAFPSSPLLVD